ncbi:MAG TPA: ABC transporter substrate-binding protein [Reyranella sp.]|nr:ABC transporter substrate-binding protein [Reyranella sp.]
MQRRSFTRSLGAALASAPLPALGQSRDKATIGLLFLSSESGSAWAFEALREGLRKYGLVDGNTIRLVARYADNKPERLEALAGELAAQGCQIIVAAGTTSVGAAQRAASKAAIVMAGSADPVMMGFAQSLGRPGGRITGVSILGEELLSKQFELLKETLPRARAFAAFLQAANPGNPAFRKAFGTISQALDVRIDVMDLRNAEEFPAAFDWATGQSVDGAFVIPDPIFAAHAESIFRLALERRLPTVCGSDAWARAGALLAYSMGFNAAWRQSARYVSEILRGADPATLPIEQPTSFTISVNLKTARALGLTIPPLILANAHEVIE